MMSVSYTHLDVYKRQEYCPAIGMKNCGITEQAPRKREAPQRSHTLCAKAMMMVMMAATVMSVSYTHLYLVYARGN